MYFRRQMRSVVGAALLFAAAAAHADVVTLSGHRTLRASGVTVAGNRAVLALRDGESITVPLSEIVAITPEPVAANVCAASPFRCQDRAMLLGRREQAQAIGAAVAASQAH
jgi:hypothetical protein